MKKKWITMGLLVCMLTICAACNTGGTESSSQPTTPASESSTIQSSQGETSSSVENSVETSADSSDDTPSGQYYTVTFDTDGGSEIAPVQVKEGDKVVKPEDPKKSSKDGEYEFIGWYYGESAWDFDNDIVTQDVVLTAKWKTAESYTPPFLPKN